HAEDGIRARNVTGVQTSALPISGFTAAFNEREQMNCFNPSFKDGAMDDTVFQWRWRLVDGAQHAGIQCRFIINRLAKNIEHTAQYGFTNRYLNRVTSGTYQSTQT